MHLKEWRDAEKLTMAEAAPLLGLSQPSISRVESGEYLPSTATVAKLIERSNGQITGPDLYAEWSRLQAERADRATSEAAA